MPESTHEQIGKYPLCLPLLWPVCPIHTVMAMAMVMPTMATVKVMTATATRNEWSSLTCIYTYNYVICCKYWHFRNSNKGNVHIKS